MRNTPRRGCSLAKMFAFEVAASCSLLSSVPAQSLKPRSVIDIAHVRIDGAVCKVHFPADFSDIRWIDDSRLLASTYLAHCNNATATDPKRFEAQAVLFDVRGSILATAHSHAELYTKGPQGTVAAIQVGEIELLNDQMHSERTLPCPNKSKTCGINLDRSPARSTDFAVCSSLDQRTQLCDFYSGWPATRGRQEALPVREDPFTRTADGTWAVSSKESWTFKSGQLTRIEKNGSNSLVFPTNLVGENGGSCEGQLSEVLPRRFLATCVGTRWYSDGMFDSIFGFSHTVLFDVSTKDLVGRIDGGAFITSALSPSGRQIAILRGGKVRLYEAP